MWIPKIDEFAQHEPSGVYFQVCARTRKKVPDGDAIVTLFDAEAGRNGRGFLLEECKQAPNVAEWGNLFTLSVNGKELSCTAEIEPSGKLLVRVASDLKVAAVRFDDPRKQALSAAQSLSSFFDGAVAKD